MQHKKNSQASVKPRRQRNKAKGKAPAKVQGPKPSRNRKRKTKIGKAIAKDFQSSAYARYAQQMQNPSGISAPSVLPDVGSTAVCSRKYQRVLSFSQATYAKLRLVMFPNLFLPGYVSGTGAQTIPVAGIGACEFSGILESESDVHSNTRGVMRFKDSVGGVASGGLSDQTDAAGVVKRGFTSALPQNATMKMVLKNLQHTGLLASSPVPVITFYGAAAGGNWTQLAITNILPEGKEITQSITIPAGGPFVKFAMAITGTLSKKTRVEISCGCDAAQFVTSASSSFAPAFGEQIVENNISQGRVTHLSMFCQNTTAEIVSSGTIAAGRVPVTFDLGNYDGNWLQSMSTLDNNRRYIGPMKTGAYVFWMPEQQDEFQIDNIAEKQKSYQDANYLVLEIPDWSAGATVEVTFTWIVEFYTPSQNFEKIVPPPKTQEFDVIWHMLSRIQAATCNPDHEQFTENWVASVKRAIRDMYGVYRDNKALIDNVGSALLLAASA